MANIVDIIVRSKDQTKQGFSSAKGEATGFQGSMKRIGETAAGFLGANLVSNAAQMVKDFVGESITAASNLNETMSKTNQVFGSSAGGIHDWAKGAVDSMGLSRQAAENAANSMGLVFTQVGFNTTAASKMSRSWTQLAADIQSFANVPAAEVLDAMQSATRGEYDALQRFVPSINAAKVEQEALKESGKKTSKELDDQDKVLAIQTLMFQQTKKAQGDFARTSDQTANSQRQANAAMENAKATLGQGLLPIVTLGAKIMERLGKTMSEHPGLIKAVAAVVGGVLVAAFTAWAISAGTAAVATLAAAAPVLAVVAIIGVLVAAIFLLVKHWHAVWNAIKAAASGVLGWFRSHWPVLAAILGGPIGLAVLVIARHWNRIKSGAVTVFNALVSFIRGIPRRILGALGNLGSLLFDAGKAVIQGLIRGVESMLGNLGGALGNVASFIVSHKGPESKDEGLLVPAGRAVMRGLRKGITSSLPALDADLGGVSSRIAGGVGGGGVAKVELHISSGNSRLDDLLVEVLRKAIRNKGGDVQVALGS